MGLAACQPWPDGVGDAGCPQGTPDIGSVWVMPVECDAQRISGGEDRGGDWWIANHWLRIVVRHPVAGLTVPGVGGGTVVDAAPWGHRDRFHELIPRLGGGWLDVEVFEPDGTGITVGGTTRALPGTSTAEGEWREVRWTLDPEAPRIRLEGGDGLYIHPSEDFDLLDGHLVQGVVVGIDGTSVTDLGGAVTTDATSLVLAPGAEAWRWLGATRPVRGVAPGATTLVAYAGGVEVARLALGDDLDEAIPAHADAVRVEAPGLRPSATVPPGTDLDLALGGSGTIDLALSWVGHRPVPAAVSWSDDAGRSGRVLVPPEGGPLGFGAGTYTLVVSAGPAIRPVEVVVPVPRSATATVSVDLAARFDPGRHVLAATAWPGSRSRYWRGVDEQSLRDARRAGLDLAVIAPEDDVASAFSGDPLAARWRSGVALTGPAGTIVAWPWVASSRHAGHGAPRVDHLAPQDALALAWGGAVQSRFTVVEPAFLEAVPIPGLVDPQPDFLALPPPDGHPADGAWDEWFAWLDAAADLVPVGPRTWVRVADPAILGPATIEDGLVRGRVVATTGGLVELDIYGVRPGDIIDLPDDPPSVNARIIVHSAAVPFERAALIGTGGTVLAEWDVTGGHLDALGPVAVDDRWVVGAAWSNDGAAWAVTGPLWIDVP